MYFCLNRVTAGGKLPLEEFCRVAADAGFQGADVDLGYGATHGADALRELYRSKKLRFGGWNPGDWRDDAAKAGEGLGKLGEYAKIAHELGIDSCATWISPSSDRPFMENWNFHVERLRPIARVLHDFGLRLGLEFVAPYHLRRRAKHEFIFTPGQVLELGDAIGPNCGLLVDSYHCYTSGTTWEHLAQIPGEKIVLVHINDAPALPLAEVKDGERLLPGKGVIELPKFIGALKKAGYNGPASVEVFSAELKAMPAAEAAKKAWEATKGLVPLLDRA